MTSTEGLTFLLVQGGQDAVVPAHLKVNLLLHALRDGPLGNDDADARLDGAQDSSVTVEDTPSGGHHRVTFVLIVILQCTGTGGAGRASVSQQESDTVKEKKNTPTSQGWPWEWR